MSVEHNPEADLFLYPASIREGLLRDQKQIGVRTRKRRIASLCMAVGIAFAVATAWTGSFGLQLTLLGLGSLTMVYAIVLHSSQRRMLTLQRNGVRRQHGRC